VEQILFRRLAIFVGGCTLEAAEAVAGDRRLSPLGDVLAGIEALVDQHLIERAGEMMDQPRFVMLETIREFAWEQLVASGEDALVGWAHADYYLAFAARGERVLYDGPDPLSWLAGLESDHPNLRAALTRFLAEGDAEAALRMAGALTPFWFQHSHLGEGQAWLEKTLAAPGANEAAPEARASASFGLGMLSLFFHQDLTRAAAAMAESAALAETANDAVAIAMAKIGESQIRLFHGEYASAARLAVEGRTRLEEAGEHKRALFGDFVEARAAHHSGNWTKAEALYDALLCRAEEIGALYHVVASLQSLALLAQARGDAALAARRFTAALRGFWDLGEQWNVAACLEGIAIAGSTRPSPRATHLLGAAARLRQVIGAPMLPADRPAYEHALKAIRQEVGNRAFDAGWSAGAELTLDAAVAEALAMIAEEPEGPPAADELVLTGASPLTRREQEVLRLLVEGLPDREIARALYITRRTASQHVGAILAKLGVASRTAAATRAVRDHLV
jgi:non-specific serine/threonine protein kinase